MILLRAREPASGGVRNRMSTQYCGLVSQTDLGRIVSLCGWVARRRDHGGVIFIDLRDREGVVQVVCDPDHLALSENTRLTHRVFDLRRPRMQHNLRLRHRVVMEARRYLDQAGFIEIETPVLTKSTPEGARDYLVPSRVHPGSFF